MNARDSRNGSVKLKSKAQAVWQRLLETYPHWHEHFGVDDSGELDMGVPAPAGSNARFLVISTYGDDGWVRFGIPYAAYSVDSDEEMLSIIRLLLSDEVAFAVTMQGDEWAGTTLLRHESEPVPGPQETITITSWSGLADKFIGPDLK